MRALPAFILFLAAILTMPAAAATLDCRINPSCAADEVTMLQLNESVSGGYVAQLPEKQPSYPYKICCSGVKGLEFSSSDINGALFLRLYSDSASVVEKAYYDNYQYEAGMKTSYSYDFNCTYADGSCPTTHTCLAGISGETSAVLSNCTGTDAYAAKICCNATDAGSPVADVLDVSASWVSSDQIRLNCTDHESGCKPERWYYLSSDGICPGDRSSYTEAAEYVTFDTDHNEHVCLWVEDNENNADTAVSSSPLMVDPTPPETTDNGDEDVHSSGYRINITCRDSTSGCSMTYYRKCCIEGECSTLGNCNYAASYSNETEIAFNCPTGICKYNLSYYSVDNAGNIEEMNPFKIIQIDTSRPECSFITAVGKYTTSADLLLEWQGTDPLSQGIVRYDVRHSVDGGEWETQQFSTSSTTYSHTFTGLRENSSHRFQCRTITQVEGSWSSAIDTIVDVTPPGAWMGFSQNYTNSSDFMVDWGGSDGDCAFCGISEFRVEYSENLGPWSSFYTGSLTRKEFTGGKAGSLYQFRVAAVDFAGLQGSYSGNANMSVDAAGPACDLGPLEEYYENSSIPLSWSGTDDYTGIRYFEVETNATGEWAPVPGGDRTESTNTVFEGRDGDVYFFRCSATDMALNTGDFSAVRHATIDISPPQITNITYESRITKNDRLFVYAEIEDAANITNATLKSSGSVSINDIQKNRTRWHVTWVISSLSVGKQNFTIRVSDSHNQQGMYDFPFEVVVCIDGDNKTFGSDRGVCRSGEMVCANGEWVVTRNATEATEYPKEKSCNGLDDNCDGIVDNIGMDFGENSSVEDTGCGCYGGASPKAEECNFVDDDCDGYVDEGIKCCEPGDRKECGTSTGECKKGYYICDRFGVWDTSRCIDGVAPVEEICYNGKDDDCDGITDEEFDTIGEKTAPGCRCMEGTTKVCGSNIGECVSGEQTCSGGTWGPCRGGVDPAPEICDKKDNDCDGQVDEDCEVCFNGRLDEGLEAGPDCGGICEVPCTFQILSMLLVFGGVTILGVTGGLWLWFRHKKEELTWETLRKKWTRA